MKNACERETGSFSSSPEPGKLTPNLGALGDGSVTLQQFFLYAAVGGGALFLVQLVLSMMGMGDADVDADLLSDGSNSSADTAFKMLSLQGLTSFFGMFGLVGLALQLESKASPTLSVLGALLGGSLSTWVIARIFRVAHTMQSSGTLDLNKAVGSRGIVNLRIAPGKPGKVTINLSGRLLELEAVSDSDSFETGAEVSVERLLADGSIKVTKL